MLRLVKIMSRLRRLTRQAHPLSGPSGVVWYAVGLAPQTLQLRGKNRGSHLMFAGAHLLPTGAPPRASIVAARDVDASGVRKCHVQAHAWSLVI